MMLLMQHAALGGKGFILFSLIFFIGLLLGSLCYVAKADTANLKLTLAIRTPPQCTINGGTEAMTVEFGEVHDALIDGVGYARVPINYGLSCSGVAQNALKMTVSWTPITINGDSAVQTDKSNLGIAIYNNDTRLNSGDSLNFIYTDTHPALYAAPVKPTGTTLDAGSFNGAMTMTLDYQ